MTTIRSLGASSKRLLVLQSVDLAQIPTFEIYENTLAYIVSSFDQAVASNVANQITFPIADSLYQASLQVPTTIQGLEASFNTRFFLSQLYTILTDTTSPTAGDLIGTRNQIENWEVGILGHAGLTELERANLLITGSIARHSLFMWAEFEDANYQMLSPGNGPSIIQQGRRGGLTRWLGWGLVCAADAIGGFIGSYYGPAGAIAVGAGGSTAAYLIFKSRGWKPW